MKKNILFAQSGGPTQVINASCYGIIKEAKKHDDMKIYAARYGVKGILSENIIEVTDVDNDSLEILRFSPSAAFGSCRHKLKDDEFEKVLEVFIKHDIGYFLYIGGNDSMDTANRFSRYVAKNGYDIKVIGIPKTIDNDLLNTHFCPGYGSAAKYIATSIREMDFDANVYEKNIITIVEVMGRDSGFLAASSALAREELVESPHLIYLPEIPFHEEEFFQEVSNVYQEKGKVLIVASEGLKDEQGNYIFLREKKTDKFGNIQMGGVGKYLESIIKENIANRVKTIEFSVLQRCAAHVASKTDNDAAVMVGSAGVRYALEGCTDVMVSIIKNNDSFSTDITPLKNVALEVKTFPKEWIDEKNRWVTKEAIDYMAPLIQGEVKPFFKDGLPKYVRFI